MRLLLEHGADPALTTEDGTTVLMAAAGVGIWAPGENPHEEEALAAVKFVYEAKGGLATDVDKNGETALHGAIYRAGSIAIAKFLIDKGAKRRREERQRVDAAHRRRRRRYTPNVLKRIRTRRRSCVRSWPHAAFRCRRRWRAPSARGRGAPEQN